MEDEKARFNVYYLQETQLDQRPIVESKMKNVDIHATEWSHTHTPNRSSNIDLVHNRI